MRTWTRNSVLSLGLVAVLLALLGVLAALQYSWLGQISDAEHSRLKKRLEDDTQRFAEEFNREFQLSFFGFQAPSDAFKEGEQTDFRERVAGWKENSRYPELVKNFYFFKNSPDAGLLKYDGEKGAFLKAPWTPDLTAVRNSSIKNKEAEPVLAKPLALLVPVVESKAEVQEIWVRTRKILHANPAENKSIPIPAHYGFLLLELDEQTIRQKVLPDLAEKYFSDPDGSGFRLEILNGAGEPVYRAHGGAVTNPDSSIGILNIKPNNFTFFAKRKPKPEGGKDGEHLLMTERIESTSVVSARTNGPAPDNNELQNTTVDIAVEDGQKGQVTVFQTKSAQSGLWTLNIQHTAGSLDQFIANTRMRNLGVSFGILALLAVSGILIVVSAQRAKRLAQRQLDFVSSVSHEFRTPLSVLYSAGENLSDGVVKDADGISGYGELIKREGKKLSGMVEQILEFAGARSGKRKYDLRPVDVEGIVREALEEFAPIITEKGFEVECYIAEGLPPVKADEAALSQALENLVSNSLKYSNGNRWIRVSAWNGGGRVKIAVEDKGIGIAGKDLKQIFEPFYRSRTVVDEQISGNGLGLSLVKQIVDAHGGTLNVESEPGAGSRFVIELDQLKTD